MQNKGNRPPSSMRHAVPESVSAGRSEHTSADDRPFAEIRRLVQDGLRLFAQHRWVFFIPFCIVSCGAFIASFYLPRTYEAATTFEVRNDPVMINLPISAGAASYKYFRNTMARDLTGVEAMRDVVENLGLLEEAERDQDGQLTPEWTRKRDSLARSLGAKLTISSTSPSELIDVVRVTYTGEEPKLGRKLVDEVKRTYIRRTGVWIYDFLVQQRDYFKREADDAAAEVLRARRDETKLRLDNPLVNPADPGGISVKLAQLESERRELLLRRREYEAELAAQKQLLLSTGTNQESTLSATSPDDLTNPAIMALAAKIQEIDRKVLELRQVRGMTDHHPDVEEQLSKRKFLESELADARQTAAEKAAFEPGLDGANPADDDSTQALKFPLFSGDALRMGLQTAAQTGKIREIDIALETNNLAIEQLRTAKSQVYDKQEEFAAVLSAVQKAKQQQAQVESTLAKIEPVIKAVEQNRLLHFSEGTPAFGGTIPISPKATTVVLMAIAAGIAVGVLFVVLAEVLDHVYRSSGQVARSLGLPLLEAIDEIVTAHDRRKHFIFRAVVSPIIIAVCLGTAGLTGATAYLSLAQPWTYDKVRHIPESFLKIFIDPPQAAGDTRFNPAAPDDNTVSDQPDV